jgi:hypothetical protein
MRLRPALPLLLVASALAACSPQADEAAPSLTQATDSAPLAAGEWLIEETAGGASARFREQGGADALALACDRASRTLSLSRAGTTAQPQRFRITVGAQQADVMMGPGGALGLGATVDVRQPIFAAFADPAAVIELSGPGLPALRLPGHPGISRVLAACG